MLAYPGITAHALRLRTHYHPGTTSGPILGHPRLYDDIIQPPRLRPWHPPLALALDPASGLAPSAPPPDMPWLRPHPGPMTYALAPHRCTFDICMTSL